MARPPRFRGGLRWLAVSRILSTRRSGLCGHFSKRLIPGVSLSALTSSIRTGCPFPCSVLHHLGFIVPPSLLTGRWALTPPFHPYRPGVPTGGMFSVTLSVEADLRPLLPRILRGRLPCGVRTFLPPASRQTSDRPPVVKTSLQRNDFASPGTNFRQNHLPENPDRNRLSENRGRRASSSAPRMAAARCAGLSRE